MTDSLSSDSLSIAEFVQSDFGRSACEKCGNELQHVDCYNCGGEGFSDHDCGEDCCVCLYPENNVECDICEGEGGWWACSNCNPGSFDD